MTKKKLPVQKGPIKIEPTSKHKLFGEKSREAQKEANQIHDGQTLRLKEPK